MKKQIKKITTYAALGVFAAGLAVAAGQTTSYAKKKTKSGITCTLKRNINFQGQGRTYKELY